MRRGGKQVQLSDALGSVLGKLDRRGGGAYKQIQVASLWPEVAGASVAAHTTGAFLREGELIVYVDSPAWATELAAMSEHYRVAINQAAGKTLVKSVRFSVSRKVQEARQVVIAEEATDGFYTQDIVPGISLSESERLQVEESVKAIPDAELREAVFRATVADLEWKKGIAARNEREKARQGR